MNEEKAIKEFIRAEIKRCLASPEYFLTKYCKIRSPNKPAQEFQLFDFQKRVLKRFHQDRKVCILKSRQLGLTTLVSGWILWNLIFKTNCSVLAISIKAETSKEIIRKIKYAFDRLPSWLKSLPGPIITDNLQSLVFESGSEVICSSSSSDAGRSKSISLLLIDEAAFIERADEIAVSAFATVSRDGQIIVLSTPNGVGNWFHQLYIGAKEGTNGFVVIDLPWWERTDRDKAWEQEERKKYSERAFEQEHCCSFLASGNAVIDLRIIDRYEKETACDPIEKSPDGSLWIWKRPEFGHRYLIATDSSRGTGGDYQAAVALDVDTLEQVGEFKSNTIDAHGFGDVIFDLASQYNGALIVSEREGYSWELLRYLIEDKQYPSVFFSANDVNDIDDAEEWELRKRKKEPKPGLATTSRTRPKMIENLQRTLGDFGVIIRSIRLLNELKVFIWHNSDKCSAQSGFNDDLVMSLSIGLYVRNVVIMRNEMPSQGVLKEPAFFASTELTASRVFEPQSNPYFEGRARQQWSIPTPGGTRETLTWLLN